MVYLQTDCLKTDVKYGTNRKEDVMFNGSMRVSQPHASKYYIKMSRSRKIWLAREIMRSISSFIRETGHWICLIRRFRMEYRRFQIRHLVRSRHWMRWKVQPFITDGMNMMLYMQAVRSWQAVIFLE